MKKGVRSSCRSWPRRRRPRLNRNVDKDHHVERDDYDEYRRHLAPRDDLRKRKSFAMAITFTCECGKSVQVGDEFAGLAGTCPGCGRTVSIPGPDGQFTERSPVLTPREAIE